MFEAWLKGNKDGDAAPRPHLSATLRELWGKPNDPVREVSRQYADARVATLPALRPCARLRDSHMPYL